MSVRAPFWAVGNVPDAMVTQPQPLLRWRAAVAYPPTVFHVELEMMSPRDAYGVPDAAHADVGARAIATARTGIVIQ